MDAAAVIDTKGEADSTPVSPRTTPTSGNTPPAEGETTTRRRSSSVSQHPNWRLSLPPEEERARRNSLSYTHPHPPRRPSSPTVLPLYDQEQEQDPTAPPPYRPPPIRHQDHDHNHDHNRDHIHNHSHDHNHNHDHAQDQEPYRPPLHVLTTPLSPWPVTLHHLPYPFTPAGPAPTPYPSISMPTPIHFHPQQQPPPFLQSYPFPTPVSPFPPPFPSGLGPASDLQTQQAYLTQALQKESERAERLVARYNALFASGEGGEAGGKSSRKVKKELASLKARIDEAGRQERLMMMRLGEVWCEGRERGRWHATGAEGVVGGRGGGGGGGGGRKTSGSVSDRRKKSAAAVLSPLVAEFVPAAAGGEKGGVGSARKGAGLEQRTGGVVFADDIWGSEEGTGKGSEEEGERGPTSVCGEGEGDKGVELDDLMWEFEEDEGGGGKDGAEGSETKAERQRRISMYHAPPFSFKAARDKRMSLPSLKTLWPRAHTVPEADDDGGFF